MRFILFLVEHLVRDVITDVLEQTILGDYKVAKAFCL